MQRAKSEKVATEKEAVKLSVKNFKQSPDVQNFYRFVYENKLRREASLMISELVDRVKANNKKKKGRRKAKAKKKIQ